jgi:hypothetical protein
MSEQRRLMLGQHLGGMANHNQLEKLRPRHPQNFHAVALDHDNPIVVYKIQPARLAYTDARAGTGMWFSYFFVPLAFPCLSSSGLGHAVWASVFVCVLLLLFTFAAMTPTARLTDNTPNARR